ncbi:MAG: fumarylacetoacetate hydrolase family protein [Alphaproteobacteria bacterium]|nr:fumarylacetoacetate hydrolase family protein [Alphaproteobacteria bacterium]
MRLATVGLPDRPGAHPVVVRDDDGVVVLDGVSDLLAVVAGGPAALDAARGVEAQGPVACRRGEVALWHPPLVPVRLRDFLAFEDHMVGGMRQSLRRGYGRVGAWALERTGLARVPDRWYRRPLFYKGNRLSAHGHDQDVRWPRGAQVLDYELELACVIGHGGRDLHPDTALDHVFGWTVFNDVTARDVQADEMGAGFHLGPARSKDFDTGNVLGPWIVTADEVGDPHDLRMTARVDGETWSEGHSGAMYHRFERLLAYASEDETLHPGEVMGSGTVGTGCGLELGRFPAPGSVVELEIERIGVLRNRFVREAETTG